MNEKNQGGDKLLLSDLGYWEMETRRLAEGRKGAGEFSEAEWGNLNLDINHALQALSPSEQPEPVAWQWRYGDCDWITKDYRPEWFDDEVNNPRFHSRPLYTQPSKQTGGGGELGLLRGKLLIAQEALERLAVGTDRTFNAETARQMAASTTAIASDAMNRLAALSTNEVG